ncbi:MAG TPA: hypothetical protein VNG89_22900 [Vicinamibacterales bacterium]|nr:hypothetical protein [Vicinamibacterales bacterium]
MALAAADRGDFDLLHDLAWRAVQLGPKNDPALLALLARAQSLSGRPHDALVMLDRLADMGVAVDAETSDDFARTRQLPGWTDVAAHLARVRRGDAAPAAAAPAAGAAAAAPAPAGEPASVPAVTAALRPAPTEAVRFSTGAFTPGGLAYDAVSGRFLFGDRLGRKLFIVGERSNHTTDFVRSEPAGLQDVAAIEIDAKRGDLWVASTAPAAGTGAVHKLQLVSGRALRSFAVAADLEPVALADLAVTAAGAVLVIDSASRHLLVLRPGASALERVVTLDAAGPASVTASDDRTVYVAHRDGVSRIDLRSRTAAPLTAASRIPLGRLERIRWRDRALIAVRAEDDGSRSIVRLDLNDSGRAVVRATTLESIAAAGPVFLTFWGDELVYLADRSNHATEIPPTDAPQPAEFTAYRLRLR